MSGVSPASPGVSVWGYANVLLRRRRLVLAMPPLAAVLVGLLSVRSPRQYTASGSFIPQEPASAQSTVGQLASQFGLAPGRGSTSTPQFYADLLQSREIMREVVLTKYDVSGSPRFSGDLVQYYEMDLPDWEEAARRAVKALKEAMGVQTDRITGVVRFQVNTRIPALSAQVATRFLELVNDYNLRRRQSQARAEREFVEQRLSQVQAELREAEEALSAFYRRNRSFESSPELRAEEERLRRQLSFRQQLYLGLAQNHEAAKIEEVRNTPVITVLERPQTFVEPKPRGTVRKAILAFFLAGFLAIGIAFAGESATRTRREASDDYGEFRVLWGDLLSDLRGGFLRRRLK